MYLTTLQFRDAPGMDFNDAESATPTQTFEVLETRQGVEYQVKSLTSPLLSPQWELNRTEAGE
jgi:hypothetical protein